MIQSLGRKFIVGGDFNSKHTFFGSRLSNTIGRELLKSITKNNITVVCETVFVSQYLTVSFSNLMKGIIVYLERLIIWMEDCSAYFTWWIESLFYHGQSLLWLAVGLNNSIIRRQSYYPQKTPDLIDFFMCCGLNRQMFSMHNSYDLSSDHSPVILTCCRAVDKRNVPEIINYNKLRENTQIKINLEVNHKSGEDIDNAINNLKN